MDTVTLALVCLGTARLSRFVTSDRILSRPRRNVLTRLGHKHPISYLIVCDWCVSVYLGAGIAAAWTAWGDTRWFTAVTLALSASYVAGFLGERTED